MKAWFDWRVTALSLVLAVASALPYLTTSVERRDYFFFDVTLTSTSAGTTQVFWDLGKGYNETDSSRQPLKVEKKPVVYRYMMPMGDFIHLRIDPNDGVGDFTFSHAQIVTTRGQVMYKFKPQDFVPNGEIAQAVVKGDTLFVVVKPNCHDPILEINLPAPIHLRPGGMIWLREGLPRAIPVFLLGLLIGAPFVATRLQRAAAALTRWAQARPRTTIAGAVVLAVAVQCHPILFLGRSFASPNNGGLMLYGQLPTLPGSQEYMFINGMASDTGALLFNHLYYPMIQRDALLKFGEWPLWNRNSLCGEPLLGQGQSMFGDPFNFLTILTDGSAWSWDVRFLLAHWLFGAGLAFIVWRLTRHLASAVLVGVSGVFIGFFTYRLCHPANFSVCYSPWILWAWTGLATAATPRRQAGWLAALVAANWIMFTSGTVKEAYMTMVCLNFAGALLLLALPQARAFRWRILGLATLAGGVFVLLTAPGWMSFLDSLHHSYTGYDTPVAHPLPLAQIIGFFDDIFYRQATVDELVVAPALNFFLLLGVAWWLVSPRLWRSDFAGRALLLAAVPPLLLAFGVVPESVIVKIPFLGNIHHTGDVFSCPLLVIGAVLAGCGFRDALQQVRARGWAGPIGRVFALITALLVIFFVTTRGQATSPFFRGYLPSLLVAIVAIPLGWRWAMTSGRASTACVVLVIGLPLLHWRHCQFGVSWFNHYAFVPGFRGDLHAPSPGVGFVDAHRGPDPVRMVGWGSTLYPSYNSAIRWESLYGVDALRNRWYQELAIEFGLQKVWNWDWYTKPEDAPRLVPEHDMMNVGFYIADPANPPLEIAGLKLLTQLDLDVYQSPTVWPRAFFTDRMATYSTALDFSKQVLKGDGRPFAARQDMQTDAPKLPADLSGRTVRPASNYRLTSNNTTFTVEATGPGVAVLSETYYAEDFKVTVDGKPAPYFRVNHTFKGVEIKSAGRHEVTFAYWPQHFTLALRLGAAGLLLLVAGLGWLWWMAPGPRVPTEGAAA